MQGTLRVPAASNGVHILFEYPFHMHALSLAVYPDGSICLDIIQNLWKPIYTVDMLLTSIQSLLTDPNCDSPANVDAAKLYRTDMKQYKRRVRRIAAKTVED